jgi:hypothetical protein
MDNPWQYYRRWQDRRFQPHALYIRAYKSVASRIQYMFMYDVYIRYRQGSRSVNIDMSGKSYNSTFTYI